MSEFALEGDELKRLIKVAKKDPLPFAYCPGSATPDDLFAMHRTKTSEMMARDLRSSGEGNKVAFGQAFVSGKLMELTCDRVVPNIAKRLKKYFKSQKVMLNIQVLDADGTVLESDIEELPDDDGLGDDAEGEITTPEVGGETQDQSEITASPDEAELRRALAGRCAVLQKAIAAIGGPAAERLQQALTVAVGQIKAGDYEKAEQTITQIEAAVARQQSVAPGETTGQPQAVDPAAEVLRALTERLRALQPRLATAPAEMAEKLKKAFTTAVDAVRAADAGRAGQLIAAIEAALAGPASTASQARAEEARAAIPLNVVALGRARIEWISVRRNLKDELVRLQKEILATCAEIEGYEDMDSETNSLFDHIAGIDTKLEETLETLVETPDGPQRKALKDRARGLIADYTAEFDADFFADVENNGFVSVNLRGAAQTALGQVSAALA